MASGDTNLRRSSNRLWYRDFKKEHLDKRETSRRCVEAACEPITWKDVNYRMITRWAGGRDCQARLLIPGVSSRKSDKV